MKQQLFNHLITIFGEDRINKHQDELDILIDRSIKWFGGVDTINTKGNFLEVQTEVQMAAELILGN